MERMTDACILQTLIAVISGSPALSEIKGRSAVSLSWLNSLVFVSIEAFVICLVCFFCSKNKYETLFVPAFHLDQYFSFFSFLSSLYLFSYSLIHLPWHLTFFLLLSLLLFPFRPPVLSILLSFFFSVHFSPTLSRPPSADGVSGSSINCYCFSWTWHWFNLTPINFKRFWHSDLTLRQTTHELWSELNFC